MASHESILPATAAKILQYTDGEPSRSKRVRFSELVNQKSDDPLKGQFVRTMPTGDEPKIETPEDTPQLPDEEVIQRRQEEIEREIYQRVFAAAERAGLEAGQRRMEEEIAQRLPRLEAIIRDLDGLPQRIFAASEQMMVETAITLVEQLVAHEVSINRAGLAERIKRLLKQAAGQGEMAIHVCPEDAEMLRALPTFQSMEVVADASVEPGSVRLENKFGGLEEDLSEQVRLVSDGLRAYLEERMEHPHNYDGAVGSGVAPELPQEPEAEAQERDVAESIPEAQELDAAEIPPEAEDLDAAELLAEAQDLDAVEPLQDDEAGSGLDLQALMGEESLLDDDEAADDDAPDEDPDGER
ncbi:FliH/SctL family protein [Magnetofaba australis]|uniref:Flagellar assembly protein FliH n=1 Tax=Magnetofaba australis IT-1 TaxID=1434232 RepID=A0A1Y2K0A9_9PROT|nr:FliH/SctL family protein [Magnetofaba australis]OSM01458.1 putative flagellar assembly protein [Magnetofaba australis IT-1]